MDVCLCVLGGLDLDDQVDSWDVETTRRDISGDEDITLFGLELLEGDFTLSLTDLSVDNLDILLDLVRELDLVCLLLLATEDDGLSTSVASQDVGEGSFTVLVRTVDGEMLNALGSLFLKILDEVNEAVSLLQELSSDLLDPVRDSGREHECLHVLWTG